MNEFHEELLTEIKSKSGIGSTHTSQDNYLGTTHYRYEITLPRMREIARAWMRKHKSLPSDQFVDVLDALISAPSFTEKMMAGILLDYATKEQRAFPIRKFEEWLAQVEGWAEIDTLCTGKYSKVEIPLDIERWEAFLLKLANSKSVEKRRASLVFLCSPISHCTERSLGALALQLIEKLKGEKNILITKAISWLLRSMIRHHRKMVESYLDKNKETLPAIAVRETRNKLAST